MGAGGRGWTGLARAAARRLRPGDGPQPPPAAPPPVSVDTAVGPLLYPGYDKLFGPVLRREGRWESAESERLGELLGPGMTFVDVGAHVGYMSVLAARAVGPEGRGFAVEPAPGNAALLRENLLRNDITNVEVIEAAAMEGNGRVLLGLSPWNSGDNRAYDVPGMDRVVVPTVRLDDVLPGSVHVDVVKVDSQGTDHRAIRGMEAIIRRCRPVMLVEFWPPAIVEQGVDPSAVVEGYRSLGYEVRVLGADEDGPEPTTAEVVAAAGAGESDWERFCTLVLRPAP